MKIVLLVLNGDARRARRSLEARYPEATVVELSRADVEKKQGLLARLRFVRAHQPDLFAVATERLGWQRGQNAFLLLGALAGAKRSVILDSHGDWREESKSGILAQAPFRVVHETALSAMAIARARRELARLEKAVFSKTFPHVNKNPVANAGENATTITYLRATPGAATQVGGASSHISGVSNALLRLGARLRFISNDQLPGIDFNQTPITILEPEPLGITRSAFDLLNSIHFVRRAVIEIQNDPPDLIYERYSRFGCAGVAASIRTNVPLFLEYNGSEVWVGRHWDRVGMLGLLARYERLNLAAAVRIFVVSEVDRKNLLKAGISAARIVVNPNGVDSDRFHPGVGGEKVREELGLAADEILVGFVGTFGPWHGVMVLAEAIKSLAEHKQIRFLLVGSGALRDEAERYLESEAKERRVIFTGPVQHDRVPALLDACDLLVSPHVPLTDGSDFFGSPTKLFEYMAIGKGIVASKLGQIAEVLTHEETALLVEPGNASELSEAILRLAESPSLRQRLGTAARQAAIERHTWTRNAQNVLDAYRAWLEEPNK